MFPNENLVTVWSAPNYCYRCGNVASIMTIEDTEFERRNGSGVDETNFKIFSAVPDQERLTPQRNTNTPLYFM